MTYETSKMLTLEELSKQLTAYNSGEIDFDEFEDWFRTDSRGLYEGPGEGLSDIIVAIEAALSKFQFEGIDEDSLRLELASAVYPFAKNRFGGPSLLPVPESNAFFAINCARAA